MFESVCPPKCQLDHHNQISNYFRSNFSVFAALFISESDEYSVNKLEKLSRWLIICFPEFVCSGLSLLTGLFSSLSLSFSFLSPIMDFSCQACGFSLSLCPFAMLCPVERWHIARLRWGCSGLMGRQHHGFLVVHEAHGGHYNTFFWNSCRRKSENRQQNIRRDLFAPLSSAPVDIEWKRYELAFIIYFFGFGKPSTELWKVSLFVSCHCWCV